MYTYKIKNIDTLYSQASASDFVDVEVEFFKTVVVEGKEEIQSMFVRRFGFALDVTKEEILAELQQHCETYASDEEVGVKSAALEQAKATVESLKGELAS